MLQAGGELDLPQETLTAERHRDLWAQRFEGHETLMAHVAREIDERHPAPTQLSIDDVVAGECRVQFRKRIGHDDNVRRGPRRGYISARVARARAADSRDRRSAKGRRTRAARSPWRRR